MLLSCRSVVIFVAAAAAVLAAAELAWTEESDNTLRLVGLGANFLSLAPFTPGQLLEIDPITGTTSPLGSGYQLESQQIGLNLAADSRGRLFNLFSRPFVDTAVSPKLHQLGPLNGHVVRSLPIDFGTGDPYLVYATAFDSEDRLHAIVLNSAPNVGAIPVLIQIDPATGQVAFGQVVDTLDYTGLAFDAEDNRFAVAAREGLVALDVATGETTILGGDLASVEIAAARPSLAFSAAGDLYAAADRLLLVDPATGTTTAISDKSFLPWTIVGLDFAVLAQSSDFDLDGDVDGADFLKWQRGESPNPLSASDLAAWELNFGNVASPITPASTAVPEPTTGLMLMLGMAATLICSRTNVSKLNCA